MAKCQRQDRLAEGKVGSVETCDFEQVSDSVIIRTVTGTIQFWNRSAESLYGWKREEAIGRVTHELLQTEFPTRLQQIESELRRDQRWKGKLVHTTRDGHRVVIDSRWILQVHGSSESLIEINSRSADVDVSRDPGLKTQSVNPEKQERTKIGKLAVSARFPKIASIVVVGGALLILVGLFYALFGHSVIQAIYEERVPWLGGWLLAGRAVTPVENYYEQADSLMLLWILRLVVFVPLALVVISKPVGALVALCSVLVFSFVLFSIVESFPPLMRSLQSLPFYSMRQVWVADDVLSYRGKPFVQTIEVGFKGDMYSPVYGIEVTPITSEASYDRDGFRNSYVPNSPDVIVLGDSYVEDGISEADTFPRQLEKHLPGLKVLNLGKAGYGPHQYVEVLRRYGIPKKPKYALLGFFGGNDLENVVSYLRWKNGVSDEGFLRINEILSAQTLVEKYAIAVRETLQYVRKRIWNQIWPYAQMAFYRSGLPRPSGHSVHPDVAVLKLGKATHKVVLPIQASGSMAKDELLRSHEFAVLRQLFAEFKDLCIKNNIRPVILYFPTTLQIYAEYSTQESGSRWLYKRARTIATKEDMEWAVHVLSQQLEIEFISVTPALKRAAEEGKLLYYPMDTHWNPEGKALAARFVADVLKAKFLIK